MSIEVIAPPADASPAVSTAPPPLKSILIGNPNASGVVCHNRNGNATYFQPIGLNEKVVKSFGSYKSMGMKLNYSCECVVHELNDTCCGVVKIVTYFAKNGKAFELADGAAVQSIASNDTLVPGNVSGAAGGVTIAAEIRESDVLTILVGISCCLSFYLFLLCELIGYLPLRLGI